MDRATRLQQVADLNGKYHFLEDAAKSLPIDAAQSGPGEGPLSGYLIGCKSNFAVSGQAWSAGLDGRRREVADRDADLVAQLRRAGATILSRLTMDEAALGAATDTPHFGRTENPAAPGHSAGGSSGGSAAAVAAGAVDAALGSDTLGSVRIPAAYCGVWGLKPGRGVLSSAGVFPLWAALDVPGVLAPDADTLRVVFDCLAPGADDAAVLPVSVPSVVEEEALAPEVRGAFGMALDAAKRLDLLQARSQTEAWHPRALVRAGFALAARELAASLGDLEGVSPALSGLLDFGAGLSPEKLARAQAELADTRAALADGPGPGQVWITPTTPDPAFRNGAPAPPTQAHFTALANVLGLPALAVPLAGRAGRPLSIQLIGAPGTERALIATGRALSAAIKGQGLAES